MKKDRIKTREKANDSTTRPRKVKVKIRPTLATSKGANPQSTSGWEPKVRRRSYRCPREKRRKRNGGTPQTIAQGPPMAEVRPGRPLRETRRRPMEKGCPYCWQITKKHMGDRKEAIREIIQQIGYNLLKPALFRFFVLPSP